MAPAAHTIFAMSHAEFDIADPEDVNATFEKIGPDLIVNLAAYTKVDLAEANPDLAQSVNAKAPATLAFAARSIDARILHLSTDFVFSGPRERPWLPSDTTSPSSVYGLSKRDGELAILKGLGPQGVIVRTAWLYSSYGDNFVKSMLALLKTRERLEVVDDQIGTPTWAAQLACALWAVALNSELQGIFHWTDAGVASWYDFAVAIQEEALQLGLLNRAIPIAPVSTAQYPRPAQRPGYSVLDKRSTIAALGRAPTHWRRNLRTMLNELATT